MTDVSRILSAIEQRDSSAAEQFLLLVPQITIDVSPRAVFTCLNTSFPNFMLFESQIRSQSAKCTNESFGQDNLGNLGSRFSR